MGGLTPLADIPYPGLLDPPDGPGQFLAALAAAEKGLLLVYTNAAARNADLPAPTRPYLAYLTTPQCLTLWNGSAWEVIWGVGQFQEVYWTSPGNIDTVGTAAYSDWITLGNVTVPAWATSAVCTCVVNGVFDIVATSNNYTFRPKIGTAVGTRIPNVIGTGLNARFTTTFVDTVPAPPTGSQSVRIQSYKVAGSGQYRADASAIATVLIKFKG